MNTTPAVATLQAFEKLVEDHDLTYDYSDDASVWRRGVAQRDAIKEMAKQLPREQVVAIWNKWIDKKIVERFRSDWYWTV